MFSFMQYCQKVGTPYGLFGQSYFPNMVEGDGATERIALLNGAAFVYTRETKTLAILKRAGIKTPVLEFGPDGCFGIDVRDEPTGFDHHEEAWVGGSQVHHDPASHQHAKLPGVDDTRVPKLNPLHPTPQQVADDERRAAKYRELVTRWIETTGHKY